MKKIITISTLLFCLTLLPINVYAQENTQPAEVKYKARIEQLSIETCPENKGEGSCYYFTLKILEGDKKGETADSIMSIQNEIRLDDYNYKAGDKVYLVETQIAEETDYYVKEPIRKTPITILVLLFIIMVLLVGRLQGLSSLIGLGVSFAVIFSMIIPMFISGTSPIMASVLGGSIILTVSIYLSHGFNRKTSIALIGTILSLGITILLAVIFTNAVRLTGFSTDESTFLIQTLETPIDMKGILLASLIIGGIGILDDITVSQVSTITELKKANPNLGPKELFIRSMKVGKDHIASMVNTLVLAYTGSALPLVMLFIATGATFSEIINYEYVAEEIVRTLVGSIGLVLAVPITSWIASKMIAKKDNNIRRGYSN